jgi:uroporphyrin-III C-methyltransferase
VTLAQGKDQQDSGLPILNPSADTLVYYMGRKDAVKIAQQLISQGPHTKDTPVQILEAVSTARERLWVSTLEEMAQGKADNWFDSNSPALIMVGEALANQVLNNEQIHGQSSPIMNALAPHKNKAA